MHVFKYIIASVVLLGQFTIANAQDSFLQELKVGDRMMDIPLGSTINYPNPSARLSDFKGKVILLDFWNTGCSASVEDFANLDTLQKQFDGEIQIIRITRNHGDKVKKLFIRSPLARNSRLPLVVADTNFTKLFPVKLPHQAWIDREGIVRAISSSVNATAENIRSLMNGGKFSLLPIAFYEGFNPKRPMFEDGLIPFEEVEQYSFFTKYINGINARIGFTIDTSSGKFIRRAFYNTPIKNLVKYAYGGFEDNLFGIPSDDRKIILEIKDSSRFIPPTDPNQITEWKWKNTYCYEIRVASYNADRLPEYMQQDLLRFFNISVAVEPRKVKGFALVKLKGNPELETKGGNPLSSFNTIEQAHVIRNQPINILVRVLASNLDSSIVVDNTDIRVHIDMKITKSKDLKVLNDQLFKYGLKLVKKEVETPMLIIREK